MIFEFLACGLGGVAPFSWSFGRAWEEAAVVGGRNPTGVTIHGRIVLRKKTVTWPLDRFDFSFDPKAHIFSDFRFYLFFISHLSDLCDQLTLLHMCHMPCTYFTPFYFIF